MPEAPIAVEALVEVTPSTYVLRVTGRSGRSPLRVVTPDGRRVAVAAPGEPFCVPAPAAGDEGWVVEGEGFSVPAPRVVRRVAAVWEALLGGAGDEELAALAPVLALLTTRTASEASVASVDDHGPTATAPDISIIVALHHRLDLLEHQIAAFAGDPLARSAQLVYVIDGPGIAGPATAGAPLLADLYRMPLRLVVLAAPGGRGVALDAAAAHADGRVLVTMAGGVVPASPGWLGPLTAAGGLAAPTLLDEHGAPLAPSPLDEPCLVVGADLFHRSGGFGSRFPGGLGAADDLVRRLAVEAPLRRIETATVHWLRTADEPTVVPGARRYASWLRTRIGGQDQST